MTMLVVTRRGLVAEDWVENIEKRDRLMVEADHLVNTAMDLGVDVAPFRQYRQALRDIPQTYSNPEDVVWPQKPSF
ncbi:phage tail assembly chaperone [Photobacterium profundum]|uniref:phage tail assembly chaperone n=1 Tax=Photobacterium profundum TaxID=74109 RepID=UPI003D0A17B5